MAETAITVPYEEMEGSPVEGFGSEGFTATRTLRCDWADRLTLAVQLVGNSTNLPQQYPGMTIARVKSVAIKGHDDDNPQPFGVDTTRASYSKALLTVNYGVTFGTLSGGGGNSPAIVVEESVDPWTEYLTLPSEQFKWGSATGTPLKDEEAPGKVFKGLKWNYTRYFLASVPSAVLTLTGKVNVAVITSSSLGLTFAAETLLYNPPNLRRQVATDGSISVTLAYSFNYKANGWNRFWRAATQTWDRIYTAAGPADPYPTGDFTALIA